MNLVLLPDETPEVRLAPGDARAVHIRTVLRRRPGDTLDVGAVGGRHGKASVVRDDARGMVLTLTWTKVPLPPRPLVLLLGRPRPQTARKILGEVASFGVAGVVWFEAVRGERAYAQSKLWTTGEWREHLHRGTAQAFTTRLPACRQAPDLATAIALGTSLLPGTAGGEQRLALDVYEACGPLDAAAVTPVRPLLVAVGAERGWAAAERDVLRDHGFGLRHLGPRVLRTETATVAALAVIAAAWGW